MSLSNPYPCPYYRETYAECQECRLRVRVEIGDKKFEGQVNEICKAVKVKRRKGNWACNK